MEWEGFVRRMWSWQWTRVETPLDDEIIAALRDESQGILDVVIKLYMLVQSRAIQLGTTAGKEERIDVGLIRHVAKQDLSLIAPMIDALRRNDRRALALYDDLVPLADHVHQTLTDATARLHNSGPRPEPNELSGTSASGTLDDATLLVMLTQMGVATDIATIILADARRKHPGASALDLVGEISQLLKERGPETRPKKKRKGETAPSPLKTELDPLDLRGVLSKGENDGHAAFLQAGYIRPPLDDVG